MLAVEILEVFQQDDQVQAAVGGHAGSRRLGQGRLRAEEVSASSSDSMNPSGSTALTNRMTTSTYRAKQAATSPRLLPLILGNGIHPCEGKVLQSNELARPVQAARIPLLGASRRV